MKIKNKEDLINLIQSKNDDDIENFIEKYEFELTNLNNGGLLLEKIKKEGKFIYFVPERIFGDLSPSAYITKIQYIIVDNEIHSIVTQNGDDDYEFFYYNKNEKLSKSFHYFNGQFSTDNYNDALYYVRKFLEKEIERLNETIKKYYE